MPVNNTIKGLSDIRRIPRLGKIRLGIKKSKGENSYPSETDYFVCPVEVQKVFGDQPKELDIIFPLDNEAEIFKANYKWYSFTALKCKGDGETAMRRVSDLTQEQKDRMEEIPDDPFEMVEVSCTCPLLESGKCGQVGSLSFMIPKVSLAGVYQIDTRSFHSIVNIGSALSLARAMAGRIAMIPFKLKRLPQKIEHDGKMETHYILSLEHSLDLKQVESIRGEKLLLGNASITSRPEKQAPFSHGFKEEPGSAGGVVEDVTPKDSTFAKEIEVSIIEVVQPQGEDKETYTIKAQEDAEAPTLEFKTKDVEAARFAYKLGKDKKRAVITYKLMADGSFEVIKIDRDIAF